MRSALTGCTVILQRRARGGRRRDPRLGGRRARPRVPRPAPPGAHVDAVVLAGGSAFGLEAIWGVMQYLEERGRGFPIEPDRGAARGRRDPLRPRAWGSPARPDRAMGHRACRRRTPGAGRRGQRRRGHRRHAWQAPSAWRARPSGGLGCAVVRARRRAPGRPDGGQRGRRRARSRDRAAHRGRARRRRRPPADRHRAPRSPRARRPAAFRPVNTTIGLVATTAALDKAGAARRRPRSAMDGFTRALSPPHLNTDGDALFCLSVGTETRRRRRPRPRRRGPGGPRDRARRPRRHRGRRPPRRPRPPVARIPSPLRGGQGEGRATPRR